MPARQPPEELMKPTKRIDSRPRGVLGVAAVLASLAAAGVVAAVALASGPAPGTTTTTITTGGTTTTVTKVVVCHKTHSKKHPQVTISISQSAWKAHLRHGDTLGACVAPTTTTTTTTATGTTKPAAAPTASPGKSGEPHGKSGEPHGQSAGKGNKNGHG
jgi:hypothetical protein